MNKQEIRQQLLQLESRDVVQKWFSIIHKRELSASRAMEITSAAKQSSEFFRNAELASYTVRPLLTYYGISTLSKALILLLRSNGGESSLKSGHGLTITNWSNILSGSEISKSLKSIGQLEVETCNGLFSELLQETNNRTSVHICSDKVDWYMLYDIPKNGFRFSFNELISRMPDLDADLKMLGIEGKYCCVNTMFYDNEKGFKCDMNSDFELIRPTFKEFGYTIKEINNIFEITCTSELFKNKSPMFLHKYVNKTMGVIPVLYLVQPFGNHYYSELALTFLLSYYLGMFVRYYPTHWISLVSGGNGDIYWPLLNRAQNYVETVFPELVIELINDVLQRKH